MTLNLSCRLQNKTNIMKLDVTWAKKIFFTTYEDHSSRTIILFLSLSLQKETGLSKMLNSEILESRI